MLKNPAADVTTTHTTGLIENEYEKLQAAWKQQLDEMEGLQAQQVSNHDDNVHFTLMHLFHSYLNQIWIDSQNMLQCAQSWNNDTNPKDAAFTINLLGLHLMKQSLKTRQELFHIAVVNDEASLGAISTTATEATRKSSSPPPRRRSLSSPICSLLLSSRWSVKLTSSPSTPTISTWCAALGYGQDDTATGCKHAFVPGSKYSLYFPAESNDNDTSLACHPCYEKLPFKKSFSADDFCALTSQTSSTFSDNNNSSSSSSNSETESLADDMLASKKLLVSEHDVNDNDVYNYQEKLLKYQLISELQESSNKVEIDDSEDQASLSSDTAAGDAAAGSSCSISADLEPKMKRSAVSSNLPHQRLNSSSTYLPESMYSSDNCNCESSSGTTANAMPKKKRNLSMFFNNRNSSSAHNHRASPEGRPGKTSFFRDRFKRYYCRNKDKNEMPRSFSSTLLQLFSASSSSSFSLHKNNKQQAQM
ncbi:hypothetical protein [Parasitella parasitica]|uniref:Uncharacterized protein n=1 Tax=Parasitella parasitica TaxID=35722 RepID=A0A0B7MVP0_9FUNG|nr:hypothetical protein [Parasitella parasitica]